MGTCKRKYINNLNKTEMEICVTRTNFSFISDNNNWVIGKESNLKGEGL